MSFDLPALEPVHHVTEGAVLLDMKSTLNAKDTGGPIMTWLHPLNFQPSAQLGFHTPNLFLPQGLRAGCSFWGALPLT